MSIIVYGPQGCGKTRHGEQLRRHFGLSRVVEADEEGLFGPQLYTQRGLEKAKALNALILTNCEPPAHVRTIARRVIAFAAAMEQAGLQVDVGAKS